MACKRDKHKDCVICGVGFYGVSHQKYCSTKCVKVAKKMSDRRTWVTYYRRLRLKQPGSGLDGKKETVEDTISFYKRNPRSFCQDCLYYPCGKGVNFCNLYKQFVKGKGLFGTNKKLIVAEV